MGQNVWSNISTPSSSSSFTVSTQTNSTDYQCRIIVSGPPLMYFPSTIVTVTDAYCPPLVITCSLLDTINNFILVGESSTQINDLATGCAANGYDNRISESVTLFVSKTYAALVSTQYSSYETVAIWIDFNNNFEFDSYERVALQALNGLSNTPVNIAIPTIGSGATLGVHRMRASLAYYVTPNPCATSVTYGETHDYTVNIMPYTRKLVHF
jgi:hypothetical protein